MHWRKYFLSAQRRKPSSSTQMYPHPKRAIWLTLSINQYRRVWLTPDWNFKQANRPFPFLDSYLLSAINDASQIVDVPIKCRINEAVSGIKQPIPTWLIRLLSDMMCPEKNQCVFSPSALNLISVQWIKIFTLPINIPPSICHISSDFCRYHESHKNNFVIFIDLTVRLLFTMTFVDC